MRSTFGSGAGSNVWYSERAKTYVTRCSYTPSSKRPAPARPSALMTPALRRGCLPYYGLVRATTRYGNSRGARELAWSVETRRVLFRHCRGGRVYGHTTAPMHGMSSPLPPTSAAPRSASPLPPLLSYSVPLFPLHPSSRLLSLEKHPTFCPSLTPPPPLSDPLPPPPPFFFLRHRLACLLVGGHARHILPPLSHPQLLVAYGKSLFSGMIICFFLFIRFFFFFRNPLLLRTLRNESVNQDPVARHSIYVAQQNSLQSTLHRATKYTQKVRSCRPDSSVRQRKIADKKSVSIGATVYVRVFVLSFLLFVVVF